MLCHSVSGLFSSAATAAALPPLQRALQLTATCTYSAASGKTPVTGASSVQKPFKKSKSRISGYNLFIKDQSAAGKQGLSILAQDWKVLDPMKKQEYEDRAAAIRGDDEKKPKPPPPAFAVFVREQFGTLKVSMPDNNSKQVMRRLGQLWQALPQEEKAARIAAAKEVQKEWLRANGPAAKP